MEDEGGRIGTDAEAYIDAIVRAGSADPATWCATKTYCMRALAITTAKGIARVLTRRRLAPPRRPSSNGPKPPSATSLAHLAHITTPLDRAVYGCDGGRVIAPTAANGVQRAGALIR